MTKPLPKTAIGVGKEGAMPSIPNTIPTELNDAARQDSAKKSRSLPETKLGPKAVGAKKADSKGKVVSPLRCTWSRNQAQHCKEISSI